MLSSKDPIIPPKAVGLPRELELPGLADAVEVERKALTGIPLIGFGGQPGLRTHHGTAKKAGEIALDSLWGCIIDSSRRFTSKGSRFDTTDASVLNVLWFLPCAGGCSWCLACMLGTAPLHHGLSLIDLSARAPPENEKPLLQQPGWPTRGRNAAPPAEPADTPLWLDGRPSVAAVRTFHNGQ
ncbi:hypothetical protein TgHK011_001314 [Trichoderma gracile]|nr:hypothetical protein TgHK011_001314 [Trichoderma gracile]